MEEKSTLRRRNPRVLEKKSEKKLEEKRDEKEKCNFNSRVRVY